MDAGELIKWALSIKPGELTVPGLLLAALIFLVVGLHRDWFVTGNRWETQLAVSEKLEKSLETCNATVKEIDRDYTDARIEIARLRTEQQFTPRPTTRRKGTAND